MKKEILCLCIGISMSSMSQNRKTFFHGKLIDSTDVVSNAHIINLKTQQGTFSNENGVFGIVAKKNDSLQISAIGYKTKILLVKPFQFREYQNLIVLKKETYILDEIILKKHNLTGILNVDSKNILTTYRQKAVAELVTQLKNLNVYEISKIGVGFNEMNLTKATRVRLPNQRFDGFGITSSYSDPSKTSILSKKLEEEKQIPNKILSEFGSYFFFTELKIPEEKYYHFITYCSFKNIFELYRKRETLKKIKILKKESKTYLRSIKKQ